jgi:hypothetical protein
MTQPREVWGECLLNDVCSQIDAIIEKLPRLTEADLGRSGHRGALCQTYMGNPILLTSCGKTRHAPSA